MEEDFLLDDDDLENQLIVQSEDEEAEAEQGQGSSLTGVSPGSLMKN